MAGFENTLHRDQVAHRADATDGSREHVLQRKSDLRRRILRTAGEQFFAHGFQRVTMNELAALLAISKKTLYANFPSKNVLVEQVLEEHLMKALIRYRQTITSGLPYTDTLFEVFRLLGKTFTQMGKRFQEELRTHRADLWRRIEILGDRTVFADLEDFLSKGVATGQLRPGINREVVVSAYVGALRETLDCTVLAHSRVSAADAFTSVTRIFLNGIVADGAHGGSLAIHDTVHYVKG